MRYNNSQEAILQSTVGGVVKTFFVLDSIKISVSSAFSSTNEWYYESVHEEPIPTLYEMWLDTNYGRSKLGQFWDYCSDIDRIQRAFDIGGFVWDGFDVMNAVLYALQGEWEQAAWSSVAIIPIAGSPIKSGAKAGKKVLSAVGNLAPAVKAKKRITSLKLTYRVTEEGAGFFERIRKALDGIYNSMNHSQHRLAVAGGVDMVFDDAEFMVKAVDDAGNTIGIVKVGNDAADAVSDGRKAIKGVGGTQLKYIPTSGVSLKATPGKTTTILGTYADDTGNILNELGNIKSMDFGPRDGGFNLLNTPDEIYNRLGPDGYWNQCNKPWLDNAIARNDIIVLATEPTENTLYRINKITGMKELSGFGREYQYLIDHGYVFDNTLKQMIKK